ncbi:hypothetical protein I316_00783 [Kwoniella heveanensis BCC8398]|uniref:Zn(2)-C6 fungal-type domain-containing protein n=1 Tax=Kwoniella heveanensis BCC8398 TaxID=1296120 RepID=A0A1B9H303_9TREE|nr:hypothetical protein I316_00783 [Kwoniella heveanensis BCC8398]
MFAEEPKKKRRQNVACDSCKLRRVKCDLSELLSSLPSTSSSSNLSLSDLVLRHPDIGCTNCKNKGLKCTTEGIVNPTKPNKGGKRIEEAKKKFGQEEEKERQEKDSGKSSRRTSAGLLEGVPRSEQDDSLLSGYGDRTQSQSQILPVSSHDMLGTTGGLDLPDHFDFTTTFEPPELTAVQPPDQPLDPTQQDMFRFLFPDFPPQQLSQTPATNGLPSLTFGPSPGLPNATGPISTQDVTPSLISHSAADEHVRRDDIHTTTTTSTFDQAWSIWQEFASNPKGAMAHVRATGQTPGASPNPTSLQNTPLDEMIDQITTIHREEPGNILGDDFLQTSAPRPISASSTYTPLTDLSAESLNDYQPQQVGLKRQRSATPCPSEISRSGKMVLLTENPWRLYTQAQDQNIVHWGRREDVQERLADKALGTALSAHLVKVFFQAVHLSYPAISPETFYLDWARAGQRSDRMRPAQEVLCAIIEAWGARYSDCPVILGLDPQKADHAPKVIQKDGTFVPGTRARTHWGRARLSACKALLDRARRMIDDHHLLRKPSVTGVQALTLYSQLSHMTDQKVVDQDHWLQARIIHSTIIEQMSLLGLMWDSDGPIVTDHSEAQLTTPQIQIRQRRLFWTHMIGDAFFSASIGQLPKMSQEDVDSAGEWIDTLHEKLPQSSFKLLAFFITTYHRLGIAAREMAIKVAYPLRRKGSADVPRICGVIRKLWKEILEIEKSINEDAYELLRTCNRNELLGFSPLNYLSNLRLSAPFLLLILHQLIREQFEFWKNVSCAYIATPSDDSTPSSTGSGHAAPHEAKSGSSYNVDLLDRLNKESVDGLLRSCRAQIGMIESLMPTGVIQSASILLRALMAIVQLLAEVPTNEQGYPSWTPGGRGWTWEAKQREVNCCCEALHQLGWAWADVGDVLDAVMLIMERLTPSPEELQQWQLKQENGQAPTRAEVARLQKEDQAENDKLMGAVLQFWPPISIPQLIESAMQKGPQWVKEGSIDQITDHISASLRASPLGSTVTPSRPPSSQSFSISPAATSRSIGIRGAVSPPPSLQSMTGRSNPLAQPPSQPAAAMSPSTTNWLETFTGTDGAQTTPHHQAGKVSNVFGLAYQPGTGNMTHSSSAPYPHANNDQHHLSGGGNVYPNLGHDPMVAHQPHQQLFDSSVIQPGVVANNGTADQALPSSQAETTQQELQNFLDRLYGDQAITMDQLLKLSTPDPQNTAPEAPFPQRQKEQQAHEPMEFPGVTLSSDEWKGLDAVYGGSKNV